eukprot:441542_1
MESFHRGQRLDLKLSDKELWLVSYIDDIKQNEIKMKYSYNMWDTTENENIAITKHEWLSTNDTRLSPLHSHTIEYITLDAKPPALSWSMPIPICYNKKQIIITANAAEDEKKDTGLWSYDIDKNTYLKLSDFPDTFKPDHYTHWIQPNTDNLFIFQNKHFQNFAIYNIKNNTWDLSHVKINDSCMVYAKSKENTNFCTFMEPVDCALTVVGNSINNLHIIGWDEVIEETQHVIFNISTNQFRKVRQWYGICKSTFHYIKSQNKLLYIANCTDPDGHGNTDEQVDHSREKEIGIYFINTLDDEIEWKLFTKLPDNVHDFQSLIGYEQILFLFENQTDEIWCFDLVYNKWFKSHKSFMNTFRSLDVITTALDNYVHCIQIGKLQENEFESVHIKFRLEQIIPQSLIRLHNNKYWKLVIGYLKHAAVPYLSNDLKQLIFKYYPIFM